MPKQVFDGTQVIRERADGKLETAPAVSLRRVTGNFTPPPREDKPWENHAKELLASSGQDYIPTKEDKDQWDQEKYEQEEFEKRKADRSEKQKEIDEQMERQKKESQGLARQQSEAYYRKRDEQHPTDPLGGGAPRGGVPAELQPHGPKGVQPTDDLMGTLPPPEQRVGQQSQHYGDPSGQGGGQQPSQTGSPPGRAGQGAGAGSTSGAPGAPGHSSQGPGAGQSQQQPQTPGNLHKEGERGGESKEDKGGKEQQGSQQSSKK